MNNDEAVAPVVAVLLILAVIVTLISLYQCTYIPSLKQQAEVGHLGDVEREFLSFSSDIENAVWRKSEGSLSRNIQLGGGDVFLSGIKSGGVLKVEEDSLLFGVSNSTGHTFNSSLIKFSYEPLGNFWQNQGYSWQKGIVNLTTGYGKETPLLFRDMASIPEDENKIFSSLFDMNYKYRPVLKKDAKGNVTGIFYNCSEVSVTITNFTISENTYVSGNGPAKLGLSINEEISWSDETSLNFFVHDESYGANPVWQSINSNLLNFMEEEFDNVDSNAGSVECGEELYIHFTSPPVKVNIRQISLSVSVF